MKHTRTLAVASLVLCACTTSSKEVGDTKLALPPGAEARSLTGDPLFPPFLTPAERKKKEGSSRKRARITTAIRRTPTR